VLLLFFGLCVLVGAGLDEAASLGYESVAGGVLMVLVMFVCKVRD